MSSGMPKEAGSQMVHNVHIYWGRTSMIELVGHLRVINILAKFENDPWKVMDVKVLTGLICPAARPPACLKKTLLAFGNRFCWNWDPIHFQYSILNHKSNLSEQYQYHYQGPLLDIWPWKALDVMLFVNSFNYLACVVNGSLGIYAVNKFRQYTFYEWLLIYHGEIYTE